MADITPADKTEQSRDFLEGLLVGLREEWEKMVWSLKVLRDDHKEVRESRDSWVDSYDKLRKENKQLKAENAEAVILSKVAKFGVQFVDKLRKENEGLKATLEARDEELVKAETELHEYHEAEGRAGLRENY